MRGIGQSAGLERPGQMLCAERQLRQAVFSVCSSFAQTHLHSSSRPAHTELFRPKFVLFENLGPCWPE